MKSRVLALQSRVAALLGPGRTAWLLLPGLVCGAAQCTTSDVVATVETRSESPSDRDGEPRDSELGRLGDAMIGETMADAGLTPTADSGAASCSALFCADFESALSGELVQNDGRLARDCERARGGDCALLASVSAPGGVAYQRVQLEEAQALYLRAYLWVSAELELNDLAIFHLGAAEPNVGLNLDLRQGDRFEVYLVEDEQALLSERGTLLRDRWACLQLAVQLDDTEGSVTLHADGTELVAATGLNTRPPNGVQLFTMGIDWSSGGQEPAQIWLDDIVLDDSPVPCL